MELINTAIETLVDLVSPEFNLKAGLIKDISAAAVLMAAIFAFLVGCFILLPKLIHAL
ncbi:diacylglycerol kinase [Daejeonella sp.]|uniref:diacylglycerol kinase n=1 Tax=Daejeonella sp. TaxID=2805397 RepID=UPI0037BF6495